MEQFSATRTELLARKAQIRLASQGRDLLMDKRDQLLEEFRRTAEVVLGGAAALEDSAVVGRRLLAEAEIELGAEMVRSAGLATRRDLPIRTTAASIMGVRVVRVEHEPVGRTALDRGYSMKATDPRIDGVADAYESQLELVLEVAASELRLRRLAEEIGKSTRRVNALEYAVIPRLIADRVRIQSVLEERERQDHFRLKRVKQRKARRDGAHGR